MKRSRFSEVQIIGVLKEHEAGVSVADLCREHGVSDAKPPRICSTVNFAGRERASCLDPVATNIRASRYRDKRGWSSACSSRRYLCGSAPSLLPRAALRRPCYNLRSGHVPVLGKCEDVQSTL